ncbi:MAG: MoaD/ThiS family protein [Candidatus Atribacteria bacterium]|nr:MoaD/ThiS family protein [Candidatus Atribacteria bacterium]
MLTRSFEPGESLADVLAKLSIEYPAIASRVFNSKERRINSLVQILINGRLLPLAGGGEAPLCNGDEVLFFNAAAGG